MSPSKHESDRLGKSHSEQETVDKNGQANDQSGKTATNKKQVANLNEPDRHEEGKSEILGTSIEHEKWDEGNSEIFGITSNSGDKFSKKHGTIDMEVLDTDWGDDNYPISNSSVQDNMIDSSLKKVGDVLSPDAKHVEIKNGDGPRASKPRATWKKLTRMLCGSNVSKQHDVIVLGKRDVHEKENKTGMDSEAIKEA